MIAKDKVDSGKPPLYEQKGFPVLQNRTYDTPEEARNCQTGDILLVEDAETGIVHNKAFDPALIEYDSSYQNEQAHSRVFERHLADVGEIVERFLGKSRIVEVGCGKGFFLGMLEQKGFDIIGFDPAYEGDNPRIRKCYFQEGSRICANGIILRHVLEHIPDPYAFLESMKRANGGGGTIYIEVPCLEWILEHRAWFDIYYEHVNYFRISDFHRMFGKVAYAAHTFGGQYISLVADLGSLRRPHRDPGDAVAFPEDFLHTAAVNDGKDGARAAIWGASSKGVIFALLKSRLGQPIETVIDINPAKQGRYLPVTGLLVQSPEEALADFPAGGTIHVMNSNYLEEIRAMTGDRYNYVLVDHV